MFAALSTELWVTDPRAMILWTHAQDSFLMIQVTRTRTANPLLSQSSWGNRASDKPPSLFVFLFVCSTWEEFYYHLYHTMQIKTVLSFEERFLKTTPTSTFCFRAGVQGLSLTLSLGIVVRKPVT